MSHIGRRIWPRATESLGGERNPAGFVSADSDASRHRALVFIDYRIGLNFHQHSFAYQSRHFDHRGGWRDICERFLVRLRDLFPTIDVGHKHSCANDVLEASTRL